MKKISCSLLSMMTLFASSWACAHYPYVAPMSYQSFNNHTTILAGFYDNPFASEVAIKNFKFDLYTPSGDKSELDDAVWSKSKTLASYSLENKVDGTYCIRGEKIANTTEYALHDKQWKTLIRATPQAGKSIPERTVYASQLKKNTKIKTVQTIEQIETFTSRNQTSTEVLKPLGEHFQVQFLTHPNAFKVGQNIQMKLLDGGKAIPNQSIEILAQTSDFSREEKVYLKDVANETGELNLVIKEKGQYLLKIDYQQPFEKNSDHLKRYKYTLSFNVID